MEQQAVSVTIVDWQKFNPRTDSKNHTWLRLQNNFFVKTFSWPSSERELFLYLSCQCSEAKSDTVTPDMALVSATLKRKPAQILADLRHLEAKGKVTLSNFKLLEVMDSKSLPTNVRTNDTDEHTYSAEFLKFWLEYPKRVGKVGAAKAFERNVNGVLELEQLDYALRHYLKYCSLNNRIHKDPTTFLNQWREWLEPEVPLDMSEEDALKFALIPTRKEREVHGQG